VPANTDGVWTGATAFSIPNSQVNDALNNHFTDSRGLFVLHAVLLHTGKILCFCGCVELVQYGPFSYLFDPANPGAQLTPIGFPPMADLFCCHYVQTLDGRVIAVGGSQHDVFDPPGSIDQAHWVYRGSTGSDTIGLFDPVTEQWTIAGTTSSPNVLQQGRWYPTALALPDGRVAVFSGRRELDDQGNPPSGVPAPFIADMVEILSPPNWGSTELTGATKALPIYPGLHRRPMAASTSPIHAGGRR
jgi:hypothetical protein